jgi:ATP-binding cassette subfamily C protein CydC
MAEYPLYPGSAGSFRELWAALRDSGRRHRRPIQELAAGLALAILAAAASAALIGLAGWLIVRSAQTGLSARSTFSWICPAAGVVALAVVRTAARYGERLTTHGATLQLLARLRGRVFASATRMAPWQLRRFHSADLLDRVQADIDSLDRVVLAVAVPGVVSAVVGAAAVTVLTLIRPTFGVANAMAFAAALAGDLVVSRRGRGTGAALSRTRAAARARLVEALDGQLELASYGAGTLALGELRAAFRATDAPRRRWSAREGTGLLMTDLAGTGALAAVLASGAGIGSRPLPPATLAFAALLTLTMLEITGPLAAAGPRAGQALAAWRRLTETGGLGDRRATALAQGADAVPHPAAGQPGQACDGAWARGPIEIRGLVAGLGEAPAISVGRLDLPAGGLVVVTGASAAGKSTLLQALAGHLTPMAGTVRIGGADPYAVGHTELVANVTLVEQDSQLLSGTVADNLRLARPAAADGELLEALRVAALAGDVSPQARLGPGGEGLSGGQRRRLAVAQAYLRRPGLLLLDEPTEGLDRATGRILLRRLRSALPGTTIVATIHDRTLDYFSVPADVMIRLDAGRVRRQASETAIPSPRSSTGTEFREV